MSLLSSGAHLINARPESEKHGQQDAVHQSIRTSPHAARYPALRLGEALGEAGGGARLRVSTVAVVAVMSAQSHALTVHALAGPAPCDTCGLRARCAARRERYQQLLGAAR
jgi:hypothetical protein